MYPLLNFPFSLSRCVFLQCVLISFQTFQVPSVDESNCNASSRSGYVLNHNVPLSQKMTSDEETLANANTNLPTAVTGFDFESELREFLENDTALSSFQLPDDTDDTDKTIEQMLSAHS